MRLYKLKGADADTGEESQQIIKCTQSKEFFK